MSSRPASDTGSGAPDHTPRDWFLSAQERGNPSTDLDRRHGGGSSWTDGNHVVPRIHGATYFQSLLRALQGMRPGDLVLFTDWRGDAEERLAGPGTEIGKVLAELSRRGVDVRGLVWRSHPDEGKFSEEENLHLGQVVNEAGGKVLLDQRVRRGGSHHQKLVLLRHPGREDQDVGFVGGIDLCRGRRDDDRHEGDPQGLELDEPYGDRPPWHDIQAEIRGPALGDLAETFRERWDDPTPLDHVNPLRAALHRVAREPEHQPPLPAGLNDPHPVGRHSVQVLRTYPDKRPAYPFAPRGERSVARAYVKAFGRARSLVYVEDQYLWSAEVAGVVARALRASPKLRLIAVVPRYPDRRGLVSGPPYRTGQLEAMRTVIAAGGDRVAVYDLESEAGRPIYVHAKICVIDDVWMSVGSDNLNLRSWTHDSELTCAVIDEERDARPPTDPAGMGDGARVLARDVRLTLWREHLGDAVPDKAMLDPIQGFDAWRRSAAALEEWHRGGRRGPRPPGRVRPHEPRPVPVLARWWAEPVYRWVVDPDGRPRELRRAGRF